MVLIVLKIKGLYILTIISDDWRTSPDYRKPPKKTTSDCKSPRLLLASCCKASLSGFKMHSTRTLLDSLEHRIPSSETNSLKQHSTPHTHTHTNQAGGRVSCFKSHGCLPETWEEI